MLIQENLKTGNNIKVKKMKTFLRAVACATKVNKSKSEKGSIRKERKEYKSTNRKYPVMVEFNVWITPLTNQGSYPMAAKHQKINFIIFAKTVVQLQI
jgi:hypothetical protein